jgi:hypothetical protein
MKQKLINLLKKIFTKHQFVVCSRNFTTNDKYGLYWRIAHKYNIKKILKDNPNLTIQGEQGDTKVQGNKYDIKEPKFWVFNIIDHDKDYQYNYQEMELFCKKYNLEIVPELLLKNCSNCGGSGKALNIKYDLPCQVCNGNGKINGNVKLSDLGSTVQDLVEFSKGKSVLADVPREGIVVRCIENGKKIFSFKVINPDFLIKYNL